MTFAKKILDFNRSLEFKGRLPEGISVLNPFRENRDTMRLSEMFYNRFYNDDKERIIILGINPGRFGAGTTGLPFTDTIRLNEKCDIPFNDFRTYEPSSVFIYEMLDAYGNYNDFFHKFYISAVCPLGFTKTSVKGKELNYNYYDSRELTNAVSGFIVDTLHQQLDFGINRNVAFCLGTGKNDAFLRKLNDRYAFFKNIRTLEHPRYIMQYKAKTKQHYITKYLEAFQQASLHFL